MPTACFSAFNHRSWLSDLIVVVFWVFVFFACLSVESLPRGKEKKKKRSWWTESLHSLYTYSKVFFCSLTFGYLWNTFFLVFRVTEGEKMKTRHIIKLRNYRWTNPASCLVPSFLFVVSSVNTLHSLSLTAMSEGLRYRILKVLVWGKHWQMLRECSLKKK